MIKLIDKLEDLPYVEFYNLYELAISKKQKYIESSLISTFDINDNQPNSRYVNIKYIKGDEWIFFTNLNSPKVRQIKSCPKISAVFFWEKIGIQIRIKAESFLTSKSFSDIHFNNRSIEKNSLAISSKQSETIDSFKNVIKNYETTLNTKNYMKRPDYWGGISFKPFSFEFWTAGEHRLNKRILYTKNTNKWEQKILQP